MLPLRERLAVFYDRLEAAAACSSRSEAFSLVCDTLVQVEDELSGLPNRADDNKNDGRMYPPQSDNEHDVDGRPELTRYRSKAHHTYVGDNGAILITGKCGVEFSKAGIDGQEIEL
jgi:hypothetical protein